MRLFHPMYVVVSVLAITYAMPMEVQHHHHRGPNSNTNMHRQIVVLFKQAVPYNPPDDTDVNQDYLRVRTSNSIRLAVENEQGQVEYRHPFVEMITIVTMNEMQTGRRVIEFPHSDLDAPCEIAWKFEDEGDIPLSRYRIGHLAKHDNVHGVISDGDWIPSNEKKTIENASSPPSLTTHDWDAVHTETSDKVEAEIEESNKKTQRKERLRSSNNKYKRPPRPSTSRKKGLKQSEDSKSGGEA
ncbi:hypothetical protein C8R42DRAFT_690066 [Lentinula raphanica]|nr:hypothetical protein C8R42DRAFT_690066 [Lentinula raphanica]